MVYSCRHNYYRQASDPVLRKFLVVLYDTTLHAPCHPSTPHSFSSPRDPNNWLPKTNLICFGERVYLNSGNQTAMQNTPTHRTTSLELLNPLNLYLAFKDCDLFTSHLIIHYLVSFLCTHLFSQSLPGSRAHILGMYESHHRDLHTDGTNICLPVMS